MATLGREDQRTACRGIRGATTLASEDPGSAQEATAELLEGLLQANGCERQDVAAAIFTLTEDLAGANPAAAARSAGWDMVPMLVVREHAGPVDVPRCLRVLLLVNTPLDQASARHLYLRGTAVLRPDLSPAARSR